MSAKNGAFPKYKSRFKLEAKTAHITLDASTGYPGLEMEARLEISIDEFLHFRTGIGADVDVDSDLLVALVLMFGDKMLMGWNLDDEHGKPVPSSGTELSKLPMALSMQIIKSWLDAIADVPAPLDNGSNYGNGSGMESPEMEASLASLPNSIGPK